MQNNLNKFIVMIDFVNSVNPYRITPCFMHFDQAIVISDLMQNL